MVNPISTSALTRRLSARPAVVDALERQFVTESRMHFDFRALSPALFHGVDTSIWVDEAFAQSIPHHMADAMMLARVVELAQTGAAQFGELPHPGQSAVEWSVHGMARLFTPFPNSTPQYRRDALAYFKDIALPESKNLVAVHASRAPYASGKTAMPMVVEIGFQAVAHGDATPDWPDFSLLATQLRGIEAEICGSLYLTGEDRGTTVIRLPAPSVWEVLLGGLSEARSVRMYHSSAEASLHDALQALVLGWQPMTHLWPSASSARDAASASAVALGVLNDVRTGLRGYTMPLWKQSAIAFIGLTLTEMPERYPEYIAREIQRLHAELHRHDLDEGERQRLRSESKKLSPLLALDELPEDIVNLAPDTVQYGIDLSANPMDLVDFALATWRATLPAAEAHEYSHRFLTHLEDRVVNFLIQPKAPTGLKQSLGTFRLDIRRRLQALSGKKKR